MVKYSRSSIKKINSSFVIEPFQQKNPEQKKERVEFMGNFDVGIYLIVPLLAGLGLGIFFDTKLGTKPNGVIIGLLLGLIGTFFNLIKIVRQFSKHA